ncbi:hypothetical protein FRC09_006507, partial [Ceratobasidium sp. 395]
LVIFVSLFAAVLWTAVLAVPTTWDQSHLGALARRDVGLGSLVLIVKAQDDVNDPGDLTVSSCLVNTGDKTLKILNDPNGPLSAWKTQTFEFYEVPSANNSSLKARSSSAVVGVNAVRVKANLATCFRRLGFSPRSIQYNPGEVATLSDPNAFTILRPGENKTVKHDLSSMYTFPNSGNYAVRPTSEAEYFRVVKDDGSIGYIQAKMYDGAEAAKWAGVHVAESGTYASLTGLEDNESHMLSKRQTFRNCNANQQKDILAAIAGANQYIAEVNMYMGAMYYLANVRYRIWFGPYEKLRWDNIPLFVGVVVTGYELKIDKICRGGYGSLKQF